MDQFAIDIDKGLSSNPKYIPSKYFYDKRGDELFQEIMELESYYLTACEFEILEQAKDSLLDYFTFLGSDFQLIEFGAGDGKKTKILLEHFLHNRLRFKYLPIDISKNALSSLMNDLDSKYPRLNGYGIHDDYFSALKRLNSVDSKKVVMFLGSNIGNFKPVEASRFLQNLRKSLRPGDYILVGIDLKKDPEIIMNAYDDPEGVTRKFNLNLLKRINRELKADFDLDNFQHTPSYDPDTGAAVSHLVSLKNQDVRTMIPDKQYHFEKGEKIFTEISQKYSIEEVKTLSTENGFKVVENFYDSKKFFVDTLWMAQ